MDRSVVVPLTDEISEEMVNSGKHTLILAGLGRPLGAR